MIYRMVRLRSGLQLKKDIISLLKQEKEISLRKLDIKLNTSNKTILMHCQELEFLGVVKLIKHDKNNKNGRPYTTVTLTDYGRKL